MNTKTFLTFALLLSVNLCAIGDTFPFCLWPNTFHSDMKTNSFDVSLEKYAGVWYEQWHILPSFLPQQKFCTCTAVQYTLDNKGEFNVQNRCINKDTGKWGGIDGKFAAKDSPHNTKGNVYFFENVIGRWAIPYIDGPYWLLDVDPNYQWALVGEPCLQSAYFLTREKNSDANKEFVDNGLKKASTYGYDMSTVQMT